MIWWLIFAGLALGVWVERGSTANRAALWAKVYRKLWDIERLRARILGHLIRNGPPQR